ncbi:hypothetical protein BGZ76_008596 [Entomortierella beljakovae]|nr:hypothetical protein BGZ76_008596 [Entomortierella beljakovae]
MQLKTLALAAVAAATVSAYEYNNCTKCVYASFPSDSVCKTLPQEQLTQLTGAFGETAINATTILLAIKDPKVKSCLCNFLSTAFNPDFSGAAGSCLKGDAPTCTPADVVDGKAELDKTAPMLNCAAGGAPAPGATTTAPADAKPTSAGIKVNVPYVLSAAVIGLAALAGL